ncbi:MAG: glucokinase regulatory-like protein, partial [Lachnospiraceae bacterium]|nr:glucokinase regulatory-like protein [Lachnospiraceae bacterium]
MEKLSSIKTEQKNKRTENIDMLDTPQILRLMNEEDKKVAFAVEKELDNIEKAVDIIYEKLTKGGRLIYCGCGTSGRLGIMDAVECPPTFGTDPELIQAIIAGGIKAIVKAVEGAEDDYNMGKEDLNAIQFTKQDVLVGIAASGRTPYVIGAVKYAKSIGAKTISITCNPGSELNSLTEVSIAPQTGAEVITGSTRLKSGTAQKLVLNMLSTSVMIKLGKVYGNLMVDLKATNEKLVERTVSIVTSVTGVK